MADLRTFLIDYMAHHNARPDTEFIEAWRRWSHQVRHG